MKEIKKRPLIFILVLAVMCQTSLFPTKTTAAESEFSDMQGHWAATYVLELTKNGAITGMSDGKFHPDDIITLPQFIKIIISSEYGEIAPINDNWASGYMNKALEIGIIGPGDVEITGPIIRSEAAKIVAMCLTNIYGESEESDTSIAEQFEDYPSSCRPCRGEFHSTIGQCYVKGIISGKPGPVFDADANLTRAESCVIIMKMLDPQLRTPPE